MLRPYIAYRVMSNPNRADTLVRPYGAISLNITVRLS